MFVYSFILVHLIKGLHTVIIIHNMVYMDIVFDKIHGLCVFGFCYTFTLKKNEKINTNIKV